MTSDMPLVSIIIPVYNGANYMEEAIDSALSQSYPNIEVLVINDGSTDDGATARTARKYGDRIKYYEKPNGGVSSALNLGIREMNGSYFSWLSHDDVYEKTKVEKQIALIKANGGDEDIIPYCSSDCINERSEVFPHSLSQKPDKLYSSREALMLVIKNTAAGCSFLIPKKVFDKVGMFDEKLRYCQDIVMWWNIFLNGFSMIMSSDLGVHYRIHKQQVTQTMPELHRVEANKIAESIVPMFAEKSDKEFNFLYYYAKGEAVHANKTILRMCFSEAEKTRLFSFSQKLSLKLICFYGYLRPFIRKVYYRLFRRVKTS